MKSSCAVRAIQTVKAGAPTHVLSPESALPLLDRHERLNVEDLIVNFLE
jgi:hypothetical protein